MLGLIENDINKMIALLVDCFTPKGRAMFFTDYSRVLKNYSRLFCQYFGKFKFNLAKSVWGHQINFACYDTHIHNVQS